MTLADLDRVIEAANGCEENLRLIHEAAGPVPEDAPMPAMSTYEAWVTIRSALTLLRKMRAGAVEVSVPTVRSTADYRLRPWLDDELIDRGHLVPAVLITPEPE